jgi:hypothetical protein
MFKETDPLWAAAEATLIQFFNAALHHVAASRSKGLPADVYKASTMLSFPEPAAFCLGYGKNTIHGSGSARGMGEAMLGAANSAIEAGIRNIDDFGQLMIFGGGMGCDRISDMTCNILMSSFITYTQAVATRHGIPVTDFSVAHATYDYVRHRWTTDRVALPTNPCWTGTPVLLTPKRFLDELPGLDDAAFWDWVVSSQGEQLRNDLGILVADNVDRHEIIRRARRRVTLRDKFGRMYAANLRDHPPTAYDTEADSNLKVVPFQLAQQYVDGITWHPPEQDPDFCAFVFSLAEEFSRLVEDSGLWRSFWDGSRKRDETAAQMLFRGAVTMLCKRLNIDVSPETNAGVGPVDFKFSQGWSKRSVVEIKFASNSKFWDNLAEQPPAYMEAEDCRCGVFLVVQHSDRDCEATFTDHARQEVQRVADQRGLDYRVVFMDVRPKLSASKRKVD